MFYSISETKLFTDLSQEQQQLVTGGQTLLPEKFAQNSFDMSDTKYLAEVSRIQTLSTSGPAGSMTGGFSILEKIETAGKNTLGVL